MSEAALPFCATPGFKKASELDSRYLLPEKIDLWEGAPLAYRKITENESTRELLVRSASELLQKKGADFSVREVCAAAGVSVGTFYTYYKNKSELILERLGLRDQMLVDALVKETSGDPKTRLIFICEFYAEYNLMRGVVSCRDVYCNMQQMPVTIEKEKETFLYQSIRNAIISGREQGVFADRGDVEASVDIIMCMLRGYGFNWCYYNGENYDLRKQIRLGMEMLMDGLRRA